MFRKILLFVLSSILVQQNAEALIIHGGTGAAVSSAPTLTADLSSTSSAIPSNFLGISVEMQDVMAGGIFTGTSPLVSLIQLLGNNGVVRFGGTSSDYPAGSGGAPALTQTIANNIAAFTTALGTGWTAIYGLNLQGLDSSVAVTHAGYIINAFGINNVIFQIGQEDDLVLSSGTYGSNWNTFYSALHSAYPSMRFGAPDVSSYLTAVSGFLSSTSLGSTGVALITGHYYAQHSNFNNPVTSISQLLSLIKGQSFPNYASGKSVISETNSLYSGGVDGLSNVLASSSYFISFAKNALAGGVAGVNMHGVYTPWVPWNPPSGRISYYNAFVKQNDGNYSAAPIFYGMYLFSKLEGQTQITTTAGTGLNGNIVAIATKNSSNNANILISNTDTVNSASVSPTQSTTWHTGTALTLSGSSCADTAPTLGGAPIGENGSWTGSPIDIVPGNSVTIPPCGAVLVQITS